MQTSVGALLFVSGIAGGIINAVAGGATLITFPAMLAAGLPPIAANASNAVAIAPGHLIAAIADREKLPVVDRWLAWALAASLGGGAAGALLLLAVPERLFVLPVPALIGFATLLFALAPQVQAWSARRRGGEAPPPLAGLGSVAGASLYGGFFGAGLGVILTAILAIRDAGDLRRVKVLKNLLATAVSLTAVAIFMVQGAVRWPETTAMLAGALAGGYAGGHLVRVLPAQATRGVVIVAGTAMSLFYAWKYWR